MHKKVDLRGLTPPEPVVRTKRLLTEAEDIALDVLVDVGPSKDDILHFAHFKHYQASVVAETASAVRLRIIKGNPPPEEEAPKAEEKAAPAEEKTPHAEESREEVRPGTSGAHPTPAGEPLLLITSDGLGEDNRRLAVALMANMLHAVADSSKKPAKIVLVNSGVALACEGSAALGSLRRLSDGGAAILVSAESLDFLGLRSRLAAGTAADVAQVTAAILSAAQVIRL
jgi:selenium metabolism protein YedF